jgi:acyl-CoA reductase-like NAD-dependent aldehyde dehydrogenase
MSATYAAPLASREDIREAIEVLTDEADAHDSVGGRSAMDRADQLRRVVTLLRASLHRVEG